jgi:hypothetical protein
MLCVKHLEMGSQEFQNGRVLAGDVSPEWPWQRVYSRVKSIMCGQSDSLPRTANIVQSLGNVTV